MFLDLRHFKFAAPAIHGVQPSNVIATANQKSRQSRPAAPQKLGAGPIPTSRMT
jgi:hypothetical protein